MAGIVADTAGGRRRGELRNSRGGRHGFPGDAGPPRCFRHGRRDRRGDSSVEDARDHV